MTLPIKHPAPPAVPVRFSQHLEASRGFAALIVVWTHAVGNEKTLDPAYTPEGFWAYTPPSHFAVLIFFVLSGYVIGLTNTGLATGPAIWQYLRKRFTRIYPIYFLCIVLALLVSSRTYPWSMVLGNLTFLQIPLTPVINENSPSWSLHFEVLYYLLFIPIAYFRLSPLLMAGFTLVLGALNQWFFPGQPLLSSYAFGFTFWLTGLALAQYSPALTNKQPTVQALLAMLFLILSIRGFDAPEAILRIAMQKLTGSRLLYDPADKTFATIIPFYDFAWLPYAVAAILLFAHKSFRYQKQVVWLLILLPAFTLIHIVGKPDIVKWNNVGLSIGFYAVTLLLTFGQFAWLEKLGEPVINLFTRVGSISYGLYIVHYPILMLFKRVPFFSGSALIFWTRFAVFLVLSLWAAYLLEKKFQPWARARLT
jgi:peptidoglycan/LPS O-acetylase OafA/YrhL